MTGGMLSESVLRKASRAASEYLRGFQDPCVHTGTEETFHNQFRRLLLTPALTFEESAISFIEALSSWRVAGVPAGLINTDETRSLAIRLALMIDGPDVGETGIRRTADWLDIEASMHRMLSWPSMRFYLRSAPGSIAEAVGRAAGNHARVGLEPLDDASGTEQFRLMALADITSCLIGFRTLVRLVSDPAILTYEAEPYAKCI
jgi:hypothetical protein